jgi:hypothetical protein
MLQKYYVMTVIFQIYEVLMNHFWCLLSYSNELSLAVFDKWQQNIEKWYFKKQKAHEYKWAFC